MITFLLNIFKSKPEPFYTVDAEVLVICPDGSNGELLASEAIKKGYREYIIPDEFN